MKGNPEIMGFCRTAPFSGEVQEIFFGITPNAKPLTLWPGKAKMKDETICFFSDSGSIIRSILE
jgi:hypothetical protein